MIARPGVVVLALALAVAALAGGLGACDSAVGDCRCGPCSDLVVRVIDGDTVELSGGEKVRYLGVNTPETTLGKDECFGAEATQFNLDRVLDQRVLLEYDEQCRDGLGANGGRLLAWVYVGDDFLNLLLVERGYARVDIRAPNDRYAAQLEAAEAEAQAAGRGLWGACPDP